MSSTTRKATPDQWQALFAAIATLIPLALSGNTGSLKELLDTLGQILDAVAAIDDPVINPEVDNLRRAMPRDANPTARDWAGFFNALAQFLVVLAPIVIPLFAEKQPPAAK